MDRSGDELITEEEGEDEVGAMLVRYHRLERLRVIGIVAAVNAPFFILMGMAWSGTVPWGVIPALSVMITVVAFLLLSQVEWQFAERLLSRGRPGDERVFQHVSLYLRTPQSRGRARRALRSLVLAWPAETWCGKTEESAKVLVKLLRPLLRSEAPSAEDVAVARACVLALAEIATPTARQALADLARSRPQAEEMAGVCAMASKLLPEVDRRIEQRRERGQLLRTVETSETLLRAHAGAGQESAEVLLRAGDE